jgi:hypothetical protein
MGVGTWLGGTYKDAIFPVSFGHNLSATGGQGYYRDLADLGKDLSAGRGKFCEIFSIKCASAFAKASAGQEFIRISVRISIKSADFRIKRASSCLKTSKSVEKFGKMYRNGQKLYRNG